MEFGNNTPCKTLTTEDLKAQLSEFLKDSFKPQRNMALLTGAAGMGMFNAAVEDIAVREPVRKKVKQMLKKRLITKEKYNNLLDMINSPDKENFVVADEVIKAMKQG